MVKPDGSRIERIPAWIRRATQDLSVSPMYEGVFWHPPTKYKRKHQAPKIEKGLRIYESHGRHHLPFQSQMVALLIFLNSRYFFA